MEVEKAINKLKNLGQNKDKSPEEILELAKKEVKLSDKDLNISSMFSDKEEKKLGKALLKKYLDDYTIENISDKITLKQLIYLEIMLVRMQGIINIQFGKTKSVPLKMLRPLHETIDKILDLKNSLGIIDKQDDKSDDYKDLNTLMKKFAIWRKNNIADRTLLCPHCGEMALLKMRIDKYDAIKHPFFKGRFLTNPELIRLYKENKITKEDFSKVLKVPLDYIDFIVKNVERTKKMEE